MRSFVLGACALILATVWQVVDSTDANAGPNGGPLDDAGSTFYPGSNDNRTYMEFGGVVDRDDPFTQAGGTAVVEGQGAARRLVVTVVVPPEGR